MNSALKETAEKMVLRPKGILAHDWSNEHSKKEFEKAHFESNPETRRKYRQLFVTTPGMDEFISATILHEETAKQSLDDGTSFPVYIESRGIVPGVRVDDGADPFGEEGKEYLTKGMDKLEARLKEYKELGLKFAKWRALIAIDEVRPSKEALDKNMQLLADYARLCQINGFVPIVEPDVLIVGSHTMAKCEAVTTEVLKLLFEKLKQKGVDLEAMILKPSMVLPGRDSGVEASPLEIATATLRVLENCVPKEVGGIAFLSGGQTSEVATANLNKVNEIGKDVPWRMTFSFARALQHPAIEVYKGKKENVSEAQKAFLKRARLNSLASMGEYDPGMEDEMISKGVRRV